jgi:hypothetical protein
MGVITTAKVVIGAEIRGRARTVQPGNREWVTVINRNHITKEESLSVYNDAQREKMSENSICNGFKATGLVPFDPQQVLSNLNPIIRTPSPLHIDMEDDQRESKTPKTIAEIKLQSKLIQDQRRLHSSSHTHHPIVLTSNF